MIQFSSLILLTAYLWAPLLCCCEGIACTSGQECAEVEIVQEGCGGEGHCSQKQASSEEPAIKKGCSCGNHQAVSNELAIQNLVKLTIEAPVTNVSSAWLAQLDPQPLRTLSQSQVCDQFLVSGKRAPSLSALSRLLI